MVSYGWLATKMIQLVRLDTSGRHTSRELYRMMTTQPRMRGDIKWFLGKKHQQFNSVARTIALGIWVCSSMYRRLGQRDSIRPPKGTQCYCLLRDDTGDSGRACVGESMSPTYRFQSLRSLSPRSRKVPLSFLPSSSASPASTITTPRHHPTLTAPRHHPTIDSAWRPLNTSRSRCRRLARVPPPLYR